MSGEITPPQQVPNQFLQQQQQQQQQQNPIAQVKEVQEIVSKLPTGAQLVAQITGADKQGNLTVRIAGSDLLLSSPIALAKGASLTLKVVNSSDTVAFQLVSVDGKLPPTQAQQVSNFLQNPPSNSLFRPLGYDAAAQKAVQIPVNTNATAQVQTSSQAPVQAQVATTAASAQAVVIGQSATPTLQGVVLSPSPEAIKLATDAISNSLPADKAQQAITTLPKNLNAGAKIDLQVSSVQTSAAPSASSPANSLNSQSPVDTSNTVLKGQDFQRAQNEQLLRDSGFVPKIAASADGTLKVSGQVVAINGNQAVVDTSIGRLVIPNHFDSSRLTVGSVLSLDISKISSQDLELEPTSIKDLFNQWPALKMLQNSLPEAAAKDGMNKLAGLDSLFASRVASFMKSVKNNNLDNWLSSDLMRQLTPETQDAMKAKLTGDFANFTRLYNDNQNSGWQTAFVPVFDGKELHQANFYVKDLNEQEDDGQNKRFVVEFGTAGFGEIQLDGLVRKNAEQNRFDLMVRTSTPLDEEMRLGITEIFTNSAEITGVKGTVDFAKLDENALRPANAVLQNQMDHSGISI